jgi:hypothetical protein
VLDPLTFAARRYQVGNLSSDNVAISDLRILKIASSTRSSCGERPSSPRVGFWPHDRLTLRGTPAGRRTSPDVRLIRPATLGPRARHVARGHEREPQAAPPARGS